MRPGFERRRNVGDVYHFALGVLSDPLDAEEVTHTTLRNAHRECSRHGKKPDLNSLLSIAHEVCRIRGGHERLGEADLTPAEPTSPCETAELAICLRADGRLPRRESRALRRHLAACDPCRMFAELQQAQRGAISALADVPLPSSLAPSTRPRLRTAARVTALAGTAALVLALAASGEIPSPATFIGQKQGPDAKAGVVEPKRKFRPREASPR
jgi:hypothetical protein